MPGAFDGEHERLYVSLAMEGCLNSFPIILWGLQTYGSEAWGNRFPHHYP